MVSNKANRREIHHHDECFVALIDPQLLKVLLLVLGRLIVSIIFTQVPEDTSCLTMGHLDFEMEWWILSWAKRKRKHE